MVTTHPTDAAVAVNGTASFTADATGDPAPTVQWQVSNDNGATFTNIAGATSKTLSFTAPLADDGKQYRAVFSVVQYDATRNAAPMLLTAPTNAAKLTVGYAVVITQQPEDLTVNAGSGASFQASATGSPRPSLRWEVSTDGGSTFGADFSFSLVSVLASGDLTTVRVGFIATADMNGYLFRGVFSNAKGTVRTKAAMLTVNLAPTVTTDPTDQTVVAGTTASFSAAATGRPVPTVQWQRSTDGGSTFNDIPGATSATLSFTAAIADTNSQYRAVFTNSVSSATSVAATLRVNPSTVRSVSMRTRWCRRCC